MVPSTSLPPDAASFGPLALGVALSRDIPAYSYWNFQLEQPEPGYIQLAFNIPRGSSIGTLAFVHKNWRTLVTRMSVMQGCMLGRTPSPV